MKNFKLSMAIAIVTLLMTTSCTMTAQNVAPGTATVIYSAEPNTYNQVYIKQTRRQLQQIMVGMTDSKKAFEDANAIRPDGTRVADLLNGGKPNNSTRLDQYTRSHFMLAVAPAENDAVMVNSANKPYQVWIATDNLSALITLQPDMDSPIGFVAVQKGSTWYCNSIDDPSTGYMQTSPKYGTYYTYY